jgi:hypothetical protein
MKTDEHEGNLATPSGGGRPLKHSGRKTVGLKKADPRIDATFDYGYVSPNSVTLSRFNSK